MIYNLIVGGLIIILLLPISQVVPEYLEFLRTYLLYGATGLLLLLWVIRMWRSKTFRLRRTALDLPIFFIFLTTVLSTIFSQNPFYSLLGVAGRHEATLPTTLALIALYYAVSTNTSPRWADRYLKITVLAIILAFSLPTIVGASPLPRVAAPNLAASWTVATATIGERPFTGSGPVTFTQDYLLRRPLWTNDQPDFAKRYLFSANWWTQILTETGLLGFLAWLLLAAVTVYMVSKTDRTNKAVTSLLTENRPPQTGLIAVIGIISLIGPFDLTLVVFLWLFLAFLAARQPETLLKVPKASGATTIILVATTLALVIIYTIGYKIVSAEYYYQQSLLDILNNSGRKAYNLQKQAVYQNPYVDYYRKAYATTNLALAAALAQEESLLDEEEKTKTVKAVLDQAVREVKVITEELAAGTVENWEARAAIYLGMSEAVPENKTEGLKSYLAAAALDPMNPQLRLRLGQLYLTNKDYQNAAGAFLAAERLKDDWAPARYQLESLAELIKQNTPPQQQATPSAKTEI